MKGLKSAALSEACKGVITVEIDLAEFNPWIFRSMVRLFRNIREHLIATTDKDTGDQTIPGFYIDDIAAAASQKETTALAEPNPNNLQEDSALTDTNNTVDLAEQAKALAEQEIDLKSARGCTGRSRNSRQTQPHSGTDKRP